MANLEQILNIAIPIGVILGFIGLMYWKMREPFDIMWGLIKKLFGSAGDGLMSIFQSNPVNEVTYK